MRQVESSPSDIVLNWLLIGYCVTYGHGARKKRVLKQKLNRKNAHTRITIQSHTLIRQEMVRDDFNDIIEIAMGKKRQPKP